MASTPKLTEGIPPPVFSYAQAAKGRTPSVTPSAIQSSQTTSGVSTPHKDTVSTVYTPSAGSERGVGSVNGSIEVVGRSDTQGDSNTDSRISISSKPTLSTPASPSVVTAPASLPKVDNDDDFTLVGGPSEHTRERHNQGANSTEKSPEEKEARRSKKGKKQKKDEKEAEKEKEEVKPELLVPAPLPVVNFWAARQEVAAKTKPISIAQTSQSVSESTNDGKSADLKKRGKSGSSEEVEKNAAGATINGAANSSKGQKKSTEAANKTKEEQGAKRTGARGSRTTEKDDKPLTTQLPPPVGDAISWPTPETAIEEEKRKAQEKAEKEERDDSNSTKQPRPKEKWVAVPYTPSVTFNTPLPIRGGRGRGGVRGGRTDAGSRASHNSNGAGGEKPTTASSPTAEGRAGKDAGVRAASIPPNSSRQPDQTTPRSARKSGVSGAPEKSKPDGLKSENSTADARNHAVLPGGEPQVSGNQDPSHRGDDYRSAKQDQSHGNISDPQMQSRSNRQNDSNLRGSEANFGKDNGSLVRDRADGRQDRGRGGYRGRGGNHNAFPSNQHPFANGHPPQPPNGYSSRQAPGPYSPPIQQQPFNNQYNPPVRGGRGGPSRAHTMPNNGMYAHFRPNGAPAPQHMAPLQTTNPMYEYPMQALSAGAYNAPFIDNISVLHMVTMQIEYYFSIDNLCKDVYLRKHMDSQGFVFLSFIAGFKRIQSLTQDFELLRYASQESEIIEIVRGTDGVDRLRRKDGWEKWVLAFEERDEVARNAGPEYVTRHQFSRGPPAPLMGLNHTAMSPAFSPNGVEQSFRPYGNGIHAQPVNGNGDSFHSETPLSAAVPDFAPGLPPINGSHDPLEADVTFNDAEVANLTLVFAAAKGVEEHKPKAPFHNSSSRTFSNGSIDGRSIAEEIHDDSPRQGRTLTNGSRISETSPEDIRRSRSPFTPLSPTKSSYGSSPPVMWVKGQRQQAVSEDNTEELYTDFRARALKKRELSASGETHADMKLLYEFWSHFLCRNFNLTMYNEFRQYAFEDARENATGGMKNLISYYDEVLNSKKKVIPETLALHYVELVKAEESGDRPAFEKLRAAWRNGALDMKSRKKIDKLVDPKLREELEQAPHQKSVS